MGGDEGPFFAQALKGSLRSEETGRKMGGGWEPRMARRTRMGERRGKGYFLGLGDGLGVGCALVGA